jgi:succinyl-CoA synthetase alpha subunit
MRYSKMIGEIGGQLEADAAHWRLKQTDTKPVVGFYCWSDCSKRKKNNGSDAGAIVRRRRRSARRLK